MANTIHFRRELCPAVEPIGFESQLDVFLRDTTQPGSPTLSLDWIATANVGVVDGTLVADFHLEDTLFSQPEEIVLDSLIAGGHPVSGAHESTALHLNGMVLRRQWPQAAP